MRSINLTILILFTIASGLLAQDNFKVLHYTETSGFDHQTRNSSLAMFQSIGGENNFTVVNDNTGDEFNSLDNLQQYEVVIFSNTSGNSLLTDSQKQNFEDYIDSGGSYLGIHAASDTYRHSAANGNGTGEWDWYAEMAGGSVQRNPNHVSGTPLYEMEKLHPHNSTKNIPEPWQKNEEYYYWENGYYNTNNTPVLEVEETVGPNGEVNSYDSPRPMSWYKELEGGGRSFYTALGHSNSDYTNDENFRKHLRDALLWAADIGSTSVLENTDNSNISVYTDNINNELHIEFKDASHTFEVSLLNISGQEIYSTKINRSTIINTDNIESGIYFLKMKSGSQIIFKRVSVLK